MVSTIPAHIKRKSGPGGKSTNAKKNKAKRAAGGTRSSRGNDSDDDSDGYSGSDSESEDYSDGEDEGKSGYKKGGYHPVRLGEVFNSRYIIEKKLGWGHFSTVWLCSDRQRDSEHRDKMVAIKVQKSAVHYTEAALDEIDLLQCSMRMEQENQQDESQSSSGDHNSSSSQQSYVVRLLDSFAHHGPNGKHMCMVFSVLGENLLAYIKRFDYRGIPIDFVKKITSHILHGLDHLHRRCSIIHTDLKPENVLLHPKTLPNLKQIQREREDKMKAQNTSSLSQLDAGKKLSKNQKKRLKQKLKKQKAKDEAERKANLQSAKEDSPTGDKQQLTELDSDLAKLTISEPPATAASADCDDHKEPSSQESQKQGLPFPTAVIADLGNACWTHKHFTDDITTRQYRAPEAIVGTTYSTSVDIWSLACMVFELVTGDYLFDPKEDPREVYTRDEDHLALISELCGKMPKCISAHGKFARQFFNRKSELRNIRRLEFWPLESVLRDKYHLKKEAAQSLATFLLPMLELDPSQRASAESLLDHSWLAVTEQDLANEIYQSPASSRSHSRASSASRASSKPHHGHHSQGLDDSRHSPPQPPPRPISAQQDVHVDWDGEIVMNGDEDDTEAPPPPPPPPREVD